MTACLVPRNLFNAPPRLKVNREMRPYELGWLNYAFSDFRTPS